MLTRQQQGIIAENYACEYLQQQGLKLLMRNFRCKFGEIDLIMLDEDDLVFVEIRYRQHDYFGSAIESINAAKRKKLLQAANTYLKIYDKEDECHWRFDWIGLSPNKNNGFIVEWLQNAWELDN